jgi:hypothetical protein
MEQQPDFEKEFSALQHLCFQLGVKFHHSPKFHCEFAGGGVECGWAIGKRRAPRRRPTSAKKGMDNFRELVREGFCPTVIMAEKAKKCAQRELTLPWTRKLGNPSRPERTCSITRKLYTTRFNRFRRAFELTVLL